MTRESLSTASAVVLVGILFGCRSFTETPPGPEPPRAAGEPVTATRAAQQVDLAPSFQIPQAAEGAISHTPAVVFTADGRRLVTATSEGELVVFDARTREILQRLRLPRQGTDRVAVDPDGQIAVWALAGGGAAVIDIPGSRVTVVEEAPEVESLVLSSDGRLVALSRRNEIEVRDAASFELRARLPGHATLVTGLAWSADRKLLASVDQDGRLLVHDAATGNTLREVRKGSPLHAVAFHPQGQRLAFGGEERKIYELDLANGGEQEISTEEQPYWITCLGYSPDGEHLAVGDESCDIWLYALREKKRVFHQKHHVECWLGTIAWASDNRTFLFGCRPNSHAGKPQVHLALTQAEAARSPQVRASRQALLDAVNREIAALAEDAGERRVLVAYRDGLLSEEDVGWPQSLALTSNIDAQTFELSSAVPTQAFVSFGAQQAASPPLENLPPKLQDLARAHRGVLEQETAKLGRSFNCNPWQIVGK